MFPQLAMAGSSGTAQPFVGFLRPDGDNGTGSFSPTPLYAELDETSPDDATTLVERRWPAYPSFDVDSFEVTLSNPSTTPSGAETITVRCRARARYTGGDPDTMTYTVILYEGAINRGNANGSFSDANWLTISFNVSASTITNHDNLRVYFGCAGTPSATTNDTDTVSFYTDVTWIEAEYTA